MSDFDKVDQARTLRNEGYCEACIAKQLDIPVSALRVLMAEDANRRRQIIRERIPQMVEAGYTAVEIADQLDIPEVQIREVLKGV